MAIMMKKMLAEQNDYFKVASTDRRLVVGLGNIGDKYNGTRHNIGFTVLDDFAQKHEFDNWQDKKDWRCLHTKTRIGDTEVILIKPTTYMNLSGQAVQAVAGFYKIDLQNIVVAHDDLAIDFGQIRSRVGGSDAGNKGIRSISSQIGEEYCRVRIGIGPNDIPSEKFVLQKFSEDEQANLRNLIRETTNILNEFIYGGVLPTDTRNFLI